MANIGEASTFQALINLIKEKMVAKEPGKGLFSGSYNDLTDAPQSLPASDVYAWAKAATKPDYTATEVGAFPVASGTAIEECVPSNASSSNKFATMSDIPVVSYPVTSVNGQSGAVSLSASDVGAYSAVSGAAIEECVPSNASSSNKFATMSDIPSGPSDVMVKDFRPVTFTGLSVMPGKQIWTDGTNIYYSNNVSQYVLDKATRTWTVKSDWNINFYGEYIWTDGTDFYYSYGSTQYVLDKENFDWNAKTWSGLSSFYKKDIWTDGTDIYYSNSTTQKVLDKSTSTWENKSWNTFSPPYGEYVWTDGTNIYYSNNNQQYILDKTTSTWTAKTWYGLTNAVGKYIWTDLEGDVYYTYSTTQYKLNKDTSTWSIKTWSVTIDTEFIWNDGTDLYYNNSNVSVVEQKISIIDLLGVPNGIATLNGNGQIPLEQTNYVNVGRKDNTTVGQYSTAEGYDTTSSGTATHAEGDTTKATGNAAHAEGYQTEATGGYSHAEGYQSKATTLYAHAEGYYTQTGASFQHVQGKYNVGKSSTLFEIGNGGSNNARANAFEVSDIGDVVAAGDITDGSGNVLSTLANSLSGKANIVRNQTKYANSWSTKTWTDLTVFYGSDTWTDGTDVYYSGGNNKQYILDKSTSTWSNKIWNGLTNFNGRYIWTDGTDIYYSYNSNHYVLDKSTSTWSTKTWSGLTSFSGNAIWTDGDNIYYSYGNNNQYILNKSTSTWSAKTWTGLTNFLGPYIWTDGTDIYYSATSAQYVLDKSTSTWSAKTWNGFTDIDGQHVWTDGTDIYYTDGNANNYVLNKSTATWSAKTWIGLSIIRGFDTWTDGNNIYYSYGTEQYILDKNNYSILENSIILKDNGDISDTMGNTLSEKLNTDADSGILSQGTTTSYTLRTETTYLRNRWIKIGNTVWIKCTFDCVTSETGYQELSVNLPQPHRCSDYTSAGICMDDSGSGTDVTCKYLFQMGKLYVKGGLSGHRYIVDHTFICDF